jgi:3',5'-cyclic AMP phosphodiesterase CpdA
VTDEFTIAHVSDFHLSSEHKRFNLRRARRLLEEIARRRVDHVVVTGDIAADGDQGEFGIARRLFKNAGLLDWRKLSVVIGNHDVFGGVHRAEDILTFPRRCRETDADAQALDFRACFHEAFDHCLEGSPSKPFPYAKVLGSVVFFGVNSVAPGSSIKNPVGSNGRVGDGQFRRLRELLEAPQLRGKRKIILIHHHFNTLSPPPGGALHSVWGAIERRTMKLHGKKRLFELFRGTGVEVVLHGHVHVNAEYERKGVRFINGGGSLLGAPDRLAFNLISIRPGAIETRIVSIPDELPALPASRPVPALQAA